MENKRIPPILREKRSPKGAGSEPKLEEPVSRGLELVDDRDERVISGKTEDEGTRL